jgi:hypothetical protein
LTGISPDAFERLARDVRAFNTRVRRIYGQTPFLDLAEALEILQNCAVNLTAERDLTQRGPRQSVSAATPRDW